MGEVLGLGGRYEFLEACGFALLWWEIERRNSG